MINWRENISLFSLCLFLCVASFVVAQTESATRPKVGLVLSGGGAKGFAHVGVLKILEQYDIPIDYIGGTSIGAIAGGLYALGYTSAQLEDMILRQDWEAMFLNAPERRYMSFYERAEYDRYLINMQLEDGKFSIPNYAVDNNGAIKLFSDLTLGFHEIDDFSQLPIPFFCVAVDLVTGEEAILTEGSLAEAMGASMAIPGVFPSVNKDGAVYVDGGVRNNFPVDQIKAMGADIVIGIDIGAELHSAEELNKLGAVIDQLTFLLGKDIYESNKANCDYFIKPDISDYNSSDFNHQAALELIEIGENAGKAFANQFAELEESLAPYTFEKVEPFERIDTVTTKFVTKFEMSGTKLPKDRVLGILGVNTDVKAIYNFEDVQEGLKRLHASMKFSSIRYELVRDTLVDYYTLILELEDYATNTVNFGAHYTTQDDVALLFNGTFNTLFLSDSRVSTDLKIAQNPVFNLSYNINRGSLPGLGIDYSYRARLMESYLDGDKIGEAYVRKNFIELNTNSVINSNATVGIGARYEHYRVQDKVGTLPLENGKYDYILYRFFFDVDTRNTTYYPTRGVNYSFNSYAITDNGFNLDNDIPTLVGNLSLEQIFSINKIWTMSPMLYSQVQFTLDSNTPPLFYDAYVGGVKQANDIVTQIPFWGLEWGEYRASNLLMLGVENRFRIADKHYLYANFNVIGTADKLRGVTANDIYYKIGGALGYSYDSLVGPLDVSFSFGSDKKIVGFLNIGYYF